MQSPIRNLLRSAAAAALPATVLGGALLMTGGCAPTYEEPAYRPDRWSYNRPAYSRSYDPAARPAQPDQITRALNNNPPSTDPAVRVPGTGDGGAQNAPPVDNTGIRLASLPMVQRGLASPVPWQEAADQMAAKVDAPELKRNLHEGMSALAPRVARALLDYKGDVAVVTVAVYTDRPGARAATPTPPNAPPPRSVMFEDGNPQPNGQPPAPPVPGVPAAPDPAGPATQPIYKHAAIALAFEGFNTQLDGTFVPRVIADQPRTPDDGRDPIDPTLSLDKQATSYVFFQLSREGLMATQVSHADLRRELAAAVDALPPTSRPSLPPPPSTRPVTGQAGGPAAVQPGDVAQGGELVPVPGPYDPGEPWRRDPAPGFYDDGRYVYAGPDYYWGTGYDPYLDDLYGCRWGSPYVATRFGWYGGYGGGYGYGNSAWYHGNHGRDGPRPGNNGNNRPPIDTSTRVSTRGQVPWNRAPVVSPTNPAAAVASPFARSSAGSFTAGRSSAASVTTGREVPMDIPASPGTTATPRTVALPRDAQGRPRLGPAVDEARVVSGPTLGPSRSIPATPSAGVRSPAGVGGSTSTGGSAVRSSSPQQLGPRIDSSRAVDGPRLPSPGSNYTPSRSVGPSPSMAPARSSSGGGDSGGNSARSSGSGSSSGSSGGSSSGGGSSRGGDGGSSSSGGSRSSGGSSGSSGGGSSGKGK